MKAAILEKLNSPLVVDGIEIPNLDCGQVRVRVLASTICGAQIGEITGAKGPDKYLPHLLGHEGCGEVLAVGAGVRYVKVGDRVVLHWRKGVGIEGSCPKYRCNGSYVGGGWVTTFNEEAVISENRLTPVPKDTPPAVASLLGCAVTTALGLINNEAHLKIGQSIAVAGVGGVGLNIVNGAAMVNAYPIIAIDVEPSKLALAHLMGATHTVESGHILNTEDGQKVDCYQIAKDIMTKGVDVFVDCTGNPGVIEAGLEVTAAGGRLILVGQTEAGRTLMLKNFRQHYCGKTVLDSQGGLTNPTEDIPRYLELYRAGRLQLDHLITHTFPLIEINEAINVVRSGRAGRVALEMS